MHNTAVKPERNPIGPDLVGQATRESNLPIFAIGGITADNITDLTRAGCQRIAVIGAIMNSDDPAAASQDLLRRLTSTT